jgi:hypothetical protein
LRGLAVDLADQPELRVERQFADDTPDGEPVPVVSIEASATVEVQRDRRDPAADDGDRLESDALLVREGRAAMSRLRLQRSDRAYPAGCPP